MKIKNTLKTKIQNMLGLSKLESNLRDIKAINIISKLNIDNDLRDEWLLSCFPSISGGIKSTKIENLKKYLNIIRPVQWGGAAKSWWRK